MRRSPASVKVLVDLGAEYGVRADHLLRGTGIEVGALAAADGEIEAEQELGVIRNLLRELPDAPGLGLRAGAQYHLTTHGLWGFALISSPDLRSAIDFGLRYLDLTFAFNRISFEERAGEGRMILDDTAVAEDVRRFLVEREGASIMTLQRELFSAAIPLLRVEVRFPAPEYAERYEEVFGVRPRFDAGRNLAAFGAAVLDLPLPQANELTASLCEQECRALLDRRRQRSGVAGQVRALLVPRAGTVAAMEEVCRSLHVTPRTLRRRLEREGTTFRALLAETRLALAEQWLCDNAMTVEEIASRLGYAEAASFHRAFARQRGMAPGAFRKQQQGGQRGVVA